MSDEAAVQERFEELQRKLVPLWRSIREMGQDEQTIVVVPSMSVDRVFRGSQQQAYEERFLFLLLLLRQPRARLVYATSLAIPESVIDYYLGLLPGVIASHARRRLFLVSPLDGSPRPLSHKLLDRPRLLARIRELITDPERAHLVPFNTTAHERDLAVALGIPMYGCDPRHAWLGTKTGGRKIFAELGIRHPLGAEDVFGEGELAAAIESMRQREPSIGQVVVKLNEGVSGEGNGIVSLTGHATIAEAIRGMRFDAPAMAYDDYIRKLARVGGVVEERIQGDDFRSPSAQLRITPLHEVERLSTHDQILGGPSGQLYIGCRFPADPAYAGTIMRDAARVGAHLAELGVIGRFALDFVAVRRGGSWETYAIEINLRKGGTTHPFLTLQFLTDGVYDPDAGRFVAPSGRPKCFVASDDVESPAYRQFTHDDLFDIAVRHRLHFEPTRQVGIVFHMMSALGDDGRLGLTAVADTDDEAEALFRRTVAALDAEAAGST